MCVIDDDGRKVAKKIIQSDLLVFLTPVTFGGYSSELKKAVDRMVCPSLLPFFIRIGGEVHHPSRYEKTPILVVLGVLPSQEPESEELFETLVARNAINMHTHGHSGIVYSTDAFALIQKKVDSLLDQAGVSQ
jgi:multimeric flavodoxin WrbA